MKRYRLLVVALFMVLLFSACSASSMLQADDDALLAENNSQTQEAPDVTEETDDAQTISEEEALAIVYEAVLADLQETYDSTAQETFIEEYPQHGQSASLLEQDDVAYWNVELSDVAIDLWDNLADDWYRISYDVQIDAMTGEVLQLFRSR